MAPTARPIATPVPTTTPGAFASFGGKVTKRGQPFAGLFVTLWAATASKACDFNPGPIDLTSRADGTFGPFRAARPGEYFVVGRFNSGEHVWAKWPNHGSIWFYDSGDCETAKPITLEAGREFTLSWEIR